MTPRSGSAPISGEQADLRPRRVSLLKRRSRSDHEPLTARRVRMCLCVVVTRRADRTPHTSVVNAGILPDPVTRAEIVGLVAGGSPTSSCTYAPIPRSRWSYGLALDHGRGPGEPSGPTTVTRRSTTSACACCSRGVHRRGRHHDDLARCVSTVVVDRCHREARSITRRVSSRRARGVAVARRHPSGWSRSRRSPRSCISRELRSD